MSRKEKPKPAMQPKQKRKWWQWPLFVVARPIGFVLYLAIAILTLIMRLLDKSLYIVMAFALAKQAGLELTTRMRKRSPFEGQQQRKLKRKIK